MTRTPTSAVAARPGHGQSFEPAGPRDGLPILTAYVCLLVGVPAQLIVEPLGAPGTPAGLVAAGLLLWWVLGRTQPGGSAWGWQPIRYAVWFLALSIIAAYVAAALSSLPGDQMRGADRGLITVMGWLGITCVAADMLGSVDAVVKLLRRLTWAAAVLSFLGILQFAVGFDIASIVRLPGLTANHALEFIGQRSDFRRVAGTASHPIEFGMMLAAILPLALHFAFRDRDRRPLLRWLPVTLVAVALPMSLSRSAILGLLFALVVLFCQWNGIRRVGMLLVVPVAAVLMRLAIPGLLGTIKSLFTAFSNDPSIQGRTDDYAVVGQFINDSPYVGRGFGTFLPQDFVILDNQYLGQIVEVGYIGLAALILIFVVGFACARGIVRRVDDPDDRDLGVALTATFTVIAMGFLTFDGFGFPMITGCLFLVLGATGAMWRLVGGRDSLPHRLRIGASQTPQNPSSIGGRS